ncbi:hypothetical protein [Roseovarius nanhaiticus]|uniref:hypothetical protein n=1 Tax=Roseovarius nanhaiticus TaxID=573024 RepID=UPI002492C4EC|nr:hypothetical protein [Roseovarius nanhaiticus]
MLTMLDFYESPEARDAPYKTGLEIRKLPKRLRLDEIEDLVEFSADLKTFEDEIAISGDAVFARANDPQTAREQANSRIRTVLKTFILARSETPIVKAHPDYETVEAWVRENEGFVAKGDLFPQGRSAAIVMLRKWFVDTALRDINASDAHAVMARMPSGKRRSFGSALTFVDCLKADASGLPAEVAACLPRMTLRVASPDKPVRWPDLPPSLRSSASAIFDALLMQTTAQADAALARVKAGEDPEIVAAEVNAARSKDVSNPAKWREGQQGHVSWLYRGALRRGRQPQCLKDLLTLDTFEAALDAHAEAARAGRVGAARETSTLKSRFTGLIQLAAKGLQDPKLATSLQILRNTRDAEVNNPYVKGLSKGADALIDTLHDGGEALYRRIVTAPEIIAEEVRVRLESWGGMPLNKRLETLKLGASAAIWALQLCRPRRRANVMFERLHAARDPSTRIALHAKTLREDGQDYVSLTPKGEVKNLRKLEFVIRAQDAKILRWWIEELRPLYIETRKIADSCYLFPGAASPRNLRTGLNLPPGCVSGAWFAEAWNAGAEIVGLRLTTHQARHTTAVIWLARHPGDFAGAAALIGSSERIVREKYGADDSAGVAAEARADAYNTYG